MTKKPQGQGRVPTAHSDAEPASAVNAPRVERVEESASEEHQETEPHPGGHDADRARLVAVARTLRRLAATIDGINPNIYPIQFLTKDDWRKTVAWAAEEITGALNGSSEELRKAG